MTYNNVMGIDVGVTTGYAVLRENDLLVETCNEIEYTTPEYLAEKLFSVAMKHGVGAILVEYPVLDRTNPYYDELKSICSAVDEFVMNFKGSQSWGSKVIPIKPGTWKIPPVMKNTIWHNFKTNIDFSKASEHMRDAIRICYYYYRWSL